MISKKEIANHGQEVIQKKDKIKKISLYYKYLVFIIFKKICYK